MSITELRQRLIRGAQGPTSGPAPTVAIAEAHIFDWSWGDLAKFGSIAAQLALLALLIDQFQLENRAFHTNMMLLTFCGFVVHYFLPARQRLRFFLAISVAGILIVLGFANGAWLIGIGLILVGICHLPIPFWSRVGILLTVGGFLALLRLDAMAAPWSLAIWPILGSMFMFRLIIYMYDLRHGQESFSLSRTLSYFFLLPNVCFPLFPVVDYSTFRRTYYDADQYWIYQRGVQWMFRGVTHLLLYRITYQYLTLPIEEITSVGSLLQFLVSNYMLYLRVSGQFHLIVGMLHLFGFHLPETHHLYFLASSFTDLWRRINIYWKDFMMKVFYYPTYFHLRRMGGSAPLVAATLVVCLVTWFLHSYQWFWLRGAPLLSSIDVLFWTILGVLLVGNSLYEAKFGRTRTLGGFSWNAEAVGPRVIGAAGMFSLMCVLWSLWTAPSLSAWLSLWSLEGFGLEAGAGLIPTLVAGTLLVSAKSWSGLLASGIAGKSTGSPAFFRAAGLTAVSILFFLAVGNSAVYSRFGPRVEGLMSGLRVNELNRQDSTLLQRGYYENLAGVGQFNSQLFELYMQRPPEWPYLLGTDLVRFTGDFLNYELRPSLAVVYHGAPLHTNRWGMRDRDYELGKPAGTFRIALLGSSQVMGEGVADDETFESFLESRLNRENDHRSFDSYEILNFGVGYYSPIQRLMLLENKVLPFEPDAVYFVAHQTDARDSSRQLGERLSNRVELPYGFLKEVAQKAGVDETTSADVMDRRIRPFGNEILARVYQRTAQLCRERGILPVWIYLAPPEEPPRDRELIPNLTFMARSAGFVVLDLSDVYEGYDLQSLQLAQWDRHPNVKAHRLIADRFFRELRDQEKLLFPDRARPIATPDSR